jgi:predicted DNA-binding transcriptional regulator AlpA
MTEDAPVARALVPTDPSVVKAKRKQNRAAKPVATPETATALTRGQLADMLQLNPRTLSRLDAERAIPGRFLIGTAVRYRRSDIIEWISAGCPRSTRRK